MLVPEINAEKEVCQLAEAFYAFLIEHSPQILGDRIELRKKALEEASKVVQARVIGSSVRAVSEALFHIGNRMDTTPPVLPKGCRNG
jgi:hypothetical protein